MQYKVFHYMWRHLLASLAEHEGETFLKLRSLRVQFKVPEAEWF